MRPPLAPAAEPGDDVFPPLSQRGRVRVGARDSLAAVQQAVEVGCNSRVVLGNVSEGQGRQA